MGYCRAELVGSITLCLTQACPRISINHRCTVHWPPADSFHKHGSAAGSAPDHMHCVTCNTVTRSHGVNRDGTSSKHGWDVEDGGGPEGCMRWEGARMHACMHMLASHASARSMVTPLSSCISLTAPSLMVSPTSTLPPNPLAFPAPNPLFFRPSKMRPFDRSRSSVRRFGPAAAAAMIPSPFNGSRPQ
jgi:hypothetical protein